MAIAEGSEGNRDFDASSGDGLVTDADPDVDVPVLFNPTASSGSTAEAIRISAGDTRWFQLVADVTGASSTPNISTKLLGDAAWNAVLCDVAATENVVSACDYTQFGAGSSAAGRFTATAALIDALVEADEDFIWSDNATNSTQAIGSDDWFTGFLVPGLPTVSASAEVLTF